MSCHQDDDCAQLSFNKLNMKNPSIVWVLFANKVVYHSNQIFRKKKKMLTSSVISLDGEESRSIKGPPERILKKQRTHSGELKYLVKWKNSGNDQATWESEEAMKDQFSELIEDYEFYNLTGERFDDTLIENIRKQKQSRKMLDLVQQQSQEQLYPNSESTGKGELAKEDVLIKKKAFKQPGKPMISYLREKKSALNQRNDEEQPEKSSLAEFNKEELNHAVKCQANKYDKMDRMELKMTSGNDYVFEIAWKKRSNGVQPFSEFFQYEQLSQIAPALIIKFLECYLLGSEQNRIMQRCQNAYISFYGPPENTLDGRINILRKMRKIQQAEEKEQHDLLKCQSNGTNDGGTNFQMLIDLDGQNKNLSQIFEAPKQQEQAQPQAQIELQPQRQQQDLKNSENEQQSSELGQLHEQIIHKLLGQILSNEEEEEKNNSQKVQLSILQGSDQTILKPEQMLEMNADKEEQQTYHLPSELINFLPPPLPLPGLNIRT